MQIIPTSNLETDFNQIEKRLSIIKDLSAWIQIDITDGILVKPSTFSLELLTKSQLNLEKNLFDIHLMVKEPINWINKCLFAQASRVVGQVEMMENREKFIYEVKNTGMEAGIGFNSSTPLDFSIPPETDLVLLMGRPMGFGEYPFDPLVFDKIKKLKDKGFRVAVDGGVSSNTFFKLKDSGVDIIYSGQYYFDLINEQ